MFRKLVIATVTALTAAMVVAVPASAEPGENPCDLAVSFLCRFVPIAPELEGDIDLTQNQPVDPNAPPPEALLPPPNPCAIGCI